MVLLRLATAASRSATRCGALPRRLVHTEAKIAELEARESEAAAARARRQRALAASRDEVFHHNMSKGDQVRPRPPL